MPWPPKMADLKSDIEVDDTRDDEQLKRALAAAIGFVERVHAGRYDFDGDPLLSGLPVPPVTFELGTIRLAVRWNRRRRSPDALIQMGELGSARIPSIDPDIDRMLRLGRHTPPVVA